MRHVLHPTVDFDQLVVAHPQGFEVILVMQQGVLHAYRNSCPHVGVGLDWGDGRCLSGDRHLRCALHGALFEADSGACVAGPCFGKALERVTVRIDAGEVVCEYPPPGSVPPAPPPESLHA